MILAHHVEVEILNFIHIRPATMPEHVLFAAVAIGLLGFAVYGAVMAVRDGYRWWSSRRSGGSLVERTAGG
jgi:hypothetical protein